MNRKIFVTEDGSHSISVGDGGLTYHSKYGSIQESIQTFIDPGLRPLLPSGQRLDIFEMGFGTGLNALLSLLEAEKEKKMIRYQTIEAFPLDQSIVRELNFCSQLMRPGLQHVFERLHSCAWGRDITISPFFVLFKIKADFCFYDIPDPMRLVYFDAFDPIAQPELWIEPIFQKIFRMMMPGGMLLTYSSRSAVRRAMQAAGFSIEKLPGPPHKREITRATKPPR